MQSFVVNHNSTNNLLLIYLSSPNEKIVLVQVMVGIFLYVNGLMMFTFLRKETFRTDTRYILFAYTLLADSVYMFLTDMLTVLVYLKYPVHMIVCTLISVVLSYLTSCTPLTLVAMCLERYVAICMPLRHATISTSRTRFFGFLIISGLSSITPLFSLIGYLAMAPSTALFSYRICFVELLLKEPWQAQGRAILLQFLYLFSMIIIGFTYIKITNAASAASSEKKKSNKKSLHTVLLHAFQLFLCVMQFLNPYLEMAFSKEDEILFKNMRYSFFIIFMITPRCLSPLIYGLRDGKFYPVFRHYALFGLDSICVTETAVRQSKIRPVQKKL